MKIRKFKEDHLTGLDDYYIPNIQVVDGVECLCINNGHVIQSIKEYFSEKVVVSNVQALPATEESLDELFKKEENE